MDNIKVISRARIAIENELKRFPDKETGGLLLGYSNIPNEVLIVEATDSGYKDTIHYDTYFKYDYAYEEHICNFLSGLYNPNLQVLGVWHKHNSFNKLNENPFSYSDEKIHEQILINSDICISILFEKEYTNEDYIQYNMRTYLIYKDRKKQRDVTDRIIWN